MKASYLLKSKNCCSLALVVMILTVAACTQQSSEPNSNITPTPYSNISDAYDFPIKPGTDAWRALPSRVERGNACQIPESLLHNMSTEGLVETVMNYPFLSDIMAYDSPWLGMQGISAQFNGITELLKRKDAGTVLLNKYMAMDAAIQDNFTDIWNNYINSTCINFLLVQDPVLSNMTSTQLRDLVQRELANAQAEENLSVVYNYCSLSTSAWMLCHIMLHVDYPPFKQKVSENEWLNTNIRDGTLDRYSLHFVPCSVRTDIISSAEQYLSGQ